MDFVRSLVNYKEEHDGSTDVPRYYEKEKDKDLGCWVKNQRDKRKPGSCELMEKRINELNSIGFVWDRKQLDQQEQELYKQTITQHKTTFGGIRINRIIIQRRSSCYRSGNAYVSLHFNSIYRLVSESSFTSSTKSLLSPTKKESRVIYLNISNLSFINIVNTY